MLITVTPELSQLFPPSKDTFLQLMQFDGDLIRNMNGRLTKQVAIDHQIYFIKQHHGIGWREWWKNIIQGKSPVVSARNEWQALLYMTQLGLAVPKVLAFGERGKIAANRQSFVLLEAVLPSVSLETLTATWIQSPPRFAFKMELVKEVARMVKMMHDHGVHHRDLYICHFLLSGERGKNDRVRNKLFLIDWHRAIIANTICAKYRIKDVAALYFSCRHLGFTSRDYFRFMKYYRCRPLRTILTEEQSFWRKVYERGERLYREHTATSD